MVSVLGPLFRTAGHVVRTQHGVTASAGQRRGDVEIRNYLRDQADAALLHDAAQAAEEAAYREHCEQQAALEAADEAAHLERCEQQAALEYLQGCAHAPGDIEHARKREHERNKQVASAFPMCFYIYMYISVYFRIIHRLQDGSSLQCTVRVHVCTHMPELGLGPQHRP